MKKHIRALCALLSAVMLLLSLAVFPAMAEDTPKDATATPVPIVESTELSPSTATPAEPEFLDITSGSVVVDVGKIYRPVHDDFEIASMSSFSTCVQPQTGNLLYANAIGTAQIMFLYYNENNILSVFNCQIEVMDVLGTIDITRSNVFVEKGQKYILDFGDLDVHSVNIMNYDTLILRSLANGKVIEAVEAGTVNIQYSYYDENETSVSTVCSIDVYKSPDPEIFNSQINSYFISLSPSMSSAFHCLACESISPDNYPIMQYHGSYGNAYQKFTVISSDDGYYRIFSPFCSSYMGIDQSSATTDADIMFINSLCLTDSQIIDWKILEGEDSRLLFVPQNAENNQIILSCQGGSVQNGDRLQLRLYDQSSNARIWSLFSTTIYINHYYDNSLQGDDSINEVILSLIEEITFDTCDLLSPYLNTNNISIAIGNLPTAYYDAPADQCTTGINNPCNDTCTTYLESNVHCKEINHIFDHMSSCIPRSNNEITVLWADRDLYTYCDHIKNTHQTHNALATTGGRTEYRSSIQVYSLYYALYSTTLPVTQQLEYLMRHILTHEIFHTFSLNDRYEIATHKLAGETSYDDSISCVMEASTDINKIKAFYEEVKEGTLNIFCEACATDIRNACTDKLFIGNHLD
ncbi:MAG: RICIN domain-containing protein [Clostridia bacterium]|nr:RICIN domain-containing protein [Clostridia bacterium]